MKKIAKTKKPVILSTGNSVMSDVTLAVKTLKDNGCRQMALLHCVSQYPAVYEDMNLRCIQTLQKKFRCVVGLSDHTEDHISSTVAISLGASILEKHITLNKKTFGPDHPFALEPHQLKELVETVRNAEKTLGDGKKHVRQSEMENHRIGRRSIIAAKDIRVGEVFTRKNLVIKRPALGLHPKHLEEILGKRASKDIEKDLWITKDCIK
jgi:sialic acid synthase SpsE